MKLSIIVPTYNVELWIEKCLLSVVNQDIDTENYEVIVINDGSPDQSASIARKLSKSYSQIKIIDQENMGLSGARNTGIRNAKGKYLLFIDSDDYIEPNVLAEMLDFAEKGDLEIAMFNQNMVIDGVKKPIDKYRPSETEVMSGMELFFYRSGDSACKYLILTDYLKNKDIFFHEDVFFLEDGEWSSRLFVEAERTAYKDIYFYNYRLREGSIVTSGSATSEEALLGYMNAAKKLIEFKKNARLQPAQKNFINNSIAKFVLLPLNLFATKKGVSQFNRVKKIIEKAGFDKLDNTGVIGSRLKQVNLYNKSIYLLYFYLLLKNSFTSIKYRLK